MLKTDLKVIHEKTATCLKVRDKCQWQGKVEKTSKFFLHLEKKPRSVKCSEEN